MTQSKYFKHPSAGEIVQATISKCCGTSVSFINGKVEGNKVTPRRCYCNNCKQDTEPIKKDYWIITDAGKYRRLDKTTNALQ
jgi:hypothetical protein